MKKGYQGLIITRDDRFFEDCENILGDMVSSIRNIGLEKLPRETVDVRSIVFLDFREIKSDGVRFMENLVRSCGAKIFVVTDQRNSEIILDLMRAGVTDVLAFPLDPVEVLGAVRRVLEQQGQEKSQGQITALFAVKGGQGTTSLAINLADHIAGLTGDKCLLADLNLYAGHVSVGLDIKRSYTPFDLYQDLERADEDLLFSSVEQHERGFYVLGMSDKIGDATEISGEGLSSMMEFLKKKVSHTVLDLPHDFSEAALVGLDAADRILLIVQQNYVSLKSAQLALLVFSNLSYDQDKIEIIINRYDAGSEIKRPDIERALKKPVLATVRNDFKSMIHSFNLGQTTAGLDHQNKINRDFKGIASLITGVNADSKKKKSWWRKRMARRRPGVKT